MRKRASLIYSPSTDTYCTNFRGNLVPIVFFNILTYHIICNYTTFYLFKCIIGEKSQEYKILYLRLIQL